MSAYISTQSIASLLRQSVLRLQSDLASTEKELATGKHADIGLALAGRAGDSLSLQGETSRLQAIITANQTVSTRLAATANILGRLQESAQELLDGILQGDGSPLNASTIQKLGETNLKELISSLNTSVQGEHIFGGTNTAAPPITDYYAPAAANKAAIDSAFLSAFGFMQNSELVADISGEGMKTFLDTQFSSLFDDLSWTTLWSSASSEMLTSRISKHEIIPASVSANLPVFQRLAEAYTMVASLGTDALNADAYRTLTLKAANLLKSAISSLIDVQANTGLVQSRINKAATDMSLQINILSMHIGDLENVNPYEAATRVASLQTQIQISYSLTSQLQHLSLVEFL
ncbi:MAG TPA: flagellar hook-associated family protein [Methylocella sp.]|nr:flagellar hook-associated family protein [Methylocella sp.]